MTRYRFDIEGLRAVAIIPILLFHAGISRLGGGFVGVDIFFVISGFLITSVILNDQDSAKFTLFGFYHRRIVRIFPALFAMIIPVLIFGTRLLPSEFDQLSESAVAAILFISNMFFWTQADYFAPAAELMPLLHTWSLGVEEQFYILYPLVLICMTGWTRQKLRIGLASLCVLSFGVSVAFMLHSNVASFFLAPSRAWELLLGAMVAVGGFPTIRSLKARQLAGLAGMALIAVTVLFVRADSGFPVPWALLPCLGTALIIAYGEGTFVGSALSLAPFRWIGRISYSLYLWHWPIIAFYRIETGSTLDWAESVVLIAASILAGAASYHLVELPFLRRFRRGVPSRAVVATGGAALASMTAFALALNATSPMWRAIDPQVERVAAYVDYRSLPEYDYQFGRGPCFRGSGDSQVRFDPALCTRIDNGRSNVVVVGDSHAAQYWRALALRFADWNVMQATASGCRPLVGTPGSARCREVIDYALGPLLRTGQVDRVILAGRWKRSELPALQPTIRHIQQAGAAVTVIGPAIEYDGAFPAILARALERGDIGSVNAWRISERGALDLEMAGLVREAGGQYVSPRSILCPGNCRLLAPEGIPMQFDYGHLTMAGARWMIAQVPAI